MTDGPQTIPIVHERTELRAQTNQWHRENLKIGLVPTMGALHDGHLSLIAQAAKTCDRIIVSIFVNPTQFGVGEDFDSYPRTQAQDCAKLVQTPTDLIFAPSTAQIYDKDFSTSITMTGPALGLETEFRPHFFSGVAIVVVKLLLLCQADEAIFGEKDYQQFLVIRRLVADLNIPTLITPAPIIRDKDGLAMSSRNVYLSPDQRKIARQLNPILKQLATTNLSFAQAEAKAHRDLLAVGFSAVDYATIRNTHTLSAPTASDTEKRALIGARIADIRLIDNMAVPRLN